MIKCSNITKAYGSNVVIDSFSYTFGDTGFYLLFGESGSGKTTFLNVVSGMIPFDSGSVEVDGREFTDTDMLDMLDMYDKCDTDRKFDYITQDTFFIDFLTVSENLRLIRDDAHKVADALTRVALDGKGGQYPTTLSGGERQRLAIARSILSEKKILFLDEPTASLDEENKRTVFSLLSEISKSCLVICSSHDSEAEDYADHVISFSKGTRTCAVAPAVVRRGKKRSEKRRRPSSELYPFLKRWSSARVRSRTPDVLFCVFMTLALCFLMLADTPRRKLDANASNLYRINVLRVDTDGDKSDDYKLLAGLDGVRDIVPSYGMLLPDTGGVFNPDTGMIEGDTAVDYELVEQYALPGNAELFPFSDRLEYGKYYTDKYQMIISDAYARFLSPDSPGDVVGRRVKKNLYGIGEVTLEIVGVLPPPNSFEYRYYQVIRSGYADLFAEYDDSVSEINPHKSEFYINGDLFDEYAKEEYFDNGTKRSYNLYFDGYYETKAFTEKYEGLFDEKGFSASPFADEEFVMPVFESLSYILLPLSGLITLLSVVFYAFIIKTELSYNNRFVSVFNYAGFTIGQVTGGLVRLNLLRLFMTAAVSGVCAAAISVVINMLNRRYIFINFEPFTYNLPLILAAVAAIAVLSALAVNFFLHRLRYKSWYENLIASRDLL